VLLSSGKNAVITPAIDELKADPTLAKITQVQRVNYLNNILEQEHRFIKRLVNPGMGFGSFNTPRRTLRGYGVKKGDIQATVELVAQIFPVAA
jgi:transposase-like protein